MKLHVMSDLHLDHYRGVPFKPTCPDESERVLVLAGDVIGLTSQNYKTALAWFTDVVARYKNVIYVVGNHEYYGTSWEGAHHERTDLEMEVLMATGKQLLVSEEFDIFQIEDQRFLCGAMWIPEPARGTPNINDVNCIKRYKPEVFRRHKTFCNGLNANLKWSDIVVTHHMPSNQSVAPQYYGDIYNAWFVAPELEKSIDAVQPRLWIHGHTHSSFDYYRKATRVLCNPRGYPNEKSTTFEHLLLVDL